MSSVFSKVSRYRSAPEVATTGADGRTRVSTALRIDVEVAGRFRHALAETDRPDHLAYKYYKQPRRWWRICDANPEFMSPQALFGKDAVATARFPVSFAGTPPWPALLAALAARVGVETARLDEEWSLVPETQVVSGQEVTVNVEHVAHAVRVTYNRLNLDTATLSALIAGFGFTVAEPQVIGRVGKPIVIPPDTAGLRG